MSFPKKEGCLRERDEKKEGDTKKEGRKGKREERGKGKKGRERRTMFEEDDFDAKEWVNAVFKETPPANVSKEVLCCVNVCVWGGGGMCECVFV